MVPQNSLFTSSRQNIFLCVRQNKDIHSSFELLEGEYMMTESSFLGELSLKVTIERFKKKQKEGQKYSEM